MPTVNIKDQNSTAIRGIDFGATVPTIATAVDGRFHTGVKGSIITKADSTYTLSIGPGVFNWPQRPDGTDTGQEPLHLILELTTFSIKASSQAFQESEYVELSTTISPYATSLQDGGIVDFFKVSKPPNPNGQDPYNLAPASYNWNLCITYLNSTIFLKFNAKKLSEYSLVKGFYYIY